MNKARVTAFKFSETEHDLIFLEVTLDQHLSYPVLNLNRRRHHLYKSGSKIERAC